MFTSIAHRCLLIAVSAASVVFAATKECRAWQAGAEPMVMRIYPVYDLVLHVRNYPYPSHELPTVGEQGVGTSQSSESGYWGGMGGGMGGGGGGGMGGGFFAVPDEIRMPTRSGLAQFGGSGTADPNDSASGGLGGGMGGGGIGGYVGGSSLARHAANPLQFSMDDLINTISSIVEPTSWVNVGGDARIEALGGVLIVVNTMAAHEQIEQLLESLRDAGGIHRSVAIEANWLELTSEQLQLLTLGQSDGRVDPEQLTKMRGTGSVLYQGRITCLNGQTVYTVSGDRHMVVTSGIPVVSSGSDVGYQPQREIPNAGVLLQITALVLPDGNQALIDVQSTVTEWRETIPRVIGMQIDSPVIAARQLATTVPVKLGESRLVGGLTVVDSQVPPANAGQKEQPQLYLVIRAEAPAAAAE